MVIDSAQKENKNRKKNGSSYDFQPQEKILPAGTGSEVWIKV